MTNDIDVQFLCKDCERYNLCLYYHGRKETSYICKFFHTKHKPGEWIPVSDRLPKSFEFVDCTCHSLIDDREDWVVETCYVPQPHNSPYSDWGNIPMLNSCECEVIAWMYRDIPKPYKAESEVEN